MKLFHVCSRRFYEKGGEKKTKWYKVGILKEADSGKKYLHLFLFPQTEFFLFETEEAMTDVQDEE
jgi:hypothetical protein